MTGWTALNVLALIASLLLLPPALVALWDWALRPDEKWLRDQEALERCVDRARRGLGGNEQ